MEKIVIIGNGISGVTLARHLRKLSDKRIILISSESEAFFSRTALMYVYMGHLQWRDLEPYESWFWDKNRIERMQGYVQQVHVAEKSISFSDGHMLSYDKLVLATGSQTATYGWEGLDLSGVQGLVSKQDLESLERHAPNKKLCPQAVIVGGGLIGVELAEMLRSREIAVTFLIRESAFWNGVLPEKEAGMISRHIASHGVSLRHSTGLERILPGRDGRVKAVRTTRGEEIRCSLVGITTGVTPNIGFLAGSSIETDKGVLVDRFLQTSAPDVYAIGDCAQQRKPIGNRPDVEAVWYTGRMMGETLARTLCGIPMEYSPGPWFNSAKFFDIEYQTYGWVLSERRRKETEIHYHWMHPDDTKCITLASDRDTGKFLGINTFGIRLRHEVLNRWLQEETETDYVVRNLKEANFDPEFFSTYEAGIRSVYQKQLIESR